MVRCPRCARKLKSHMAVLAHMNQPLGSCLSYIAEVAATQSALSRAETGDSASDPENSAMGSAAWPGAGDTFFRADEPDYDSMAVDDSHPNERTQSFASNIEEFPGAARTFGKGESFLEDFNNDPYATERQANLYYPFSSKEEWELASFLLLSGLSMANITRFLSLRLVSKLFNVFRMQTNCRPLGAAAPAFLSLCQRPSLTGRNAPNGPPVEVQAVGCSSTNQTTFSALLSRSS